MQLTIRGKQLDVGDALREHVSANLSHSLAKYFDNPIEATVVFSRDAHLYRVQIQGHLGRGMQLQAHAEATEPYAAFDAANGRIEKRARRFKRRLRDHHKDASEPDLLPAQAYILEGSPDVSEEDDTEADVAVAANGQPTVIAEMSTNIARMTVSEAVMRLDLSDQTAMMFRNSAHGGLNVIYRRPDGNIGWIDPQGNPQS